MMTGLSLGNSHEVLELICGDTSLDAFVWDFPVPDGYILRREVLYPEPIYVPVV
jgi:hypothetical protein